MTLALYLSLNRVPPKASRVRSSFSNEETTSEIIYITRDLRRCCWTASNHTNSLSNKGTSFDSIHIRGDGTREETHSLRRPGSKMVCNAEQYSQSIHQLTAQSSLPRLGGVPSSLQFLHEEVGLSGAAWESLGVEWRALGAQWVQAETALSRSGRTDLSFNEVCKAPIPNEWKEWMNAKLMNIDVKRLAESFRKVFTDYLKSLPSTTLKAGGTVGMPMWCRPGKTGVPGLLLCLYWQAEYAGVGNN
jgi:hypothetical protein